MSSSSNSGGAASVRDGCRSSGANGVFITPFYKHCAPPERKRLHLCRYLSWTVCATAARSRSFDRQDLFHNRATAKVFLKAVRPCANQPRPRKIIVENLAITHPAARSNVRAFLTKPEPVTEASAAKDEIIARARNFKTRAFDHLPSKTSSDNELEIPASNRPASRAVYRHDLG